MVAELHRELGFRKLHVVAHSMGGLVARDSYMNECVREAGWTVISMQFDSKRIFAWQQ